MAIDHGAFFHPRRKSVHVHDFLAPYLATQELLGTQGPQGTHGPQGTWGPGDPGAQGPLGLASFPPAGSKNPSANLYIDIYIYISE